MKLAAGSRYTSLVDSLRDRGWEIAPGDPTPVRAVTLFREGRQHEIDWSFDAALGRYILTLSSPPWPSDARFSGGARQRLVDRSRRVEPFTQLLVPTADESLDGEVTNRLIEVLEGELPNVLPDAKAVWGGAIASTGKGGVEWLSEHKAHLVVPRGDREHAITLYAYEGGVARGDRRGVRERSAKPASP